MNKLSKLLLAVTLLFALLTPAARADDTVHLLTTRSFGGLIPELGAAELVVFDRDRSCDLEVYLFDLWSGTEVQYGVYAVYYAVVFYQPETGRHPEVIPVLADRELTNATRLLVQDEAPAFWFQYPTCPEDGVIYIPERSGVQLQAVPGR